MSTMYKSLRFLGLNTATGLRTPVDPTDAFRLVDFREGAASITSSFQEADQNLQQAQQQGDLALRNDLNAAIAQLEAAYQAAVQAEAQTRQAQDQALISGFTPKDPVYAVVNATVGLTGLDVTSPSFTGAIPALTNGQPTRVLVVAQGGDIATPHPANGVYTVAAGAWTRAVDFNEDSEVRRSILVPVENNGEEGFANTIFFLREPEIFQNTTIGTTPLRFARWLGTDLVLADELTIHREGNVLSTRYNPDQIHVAPAGLELLPAFINQLRDLTQATGLLSVDQINDLRGFVTAVTLNSFAAPTAAVPFNDQRLTGLADPTAPQDAVNQRTLTQAVNQVNSAINALSVSLNEAIQEQEDKDGYFLLSGGTVIDGDLVVQVTHNKNSFKIMKEVLDATTGETVDTDFVRIMNDGNRCQVIFRGQTAITPNQFALMIHRVA